GDGVAQTDGRGAPLQDGGARGGHLHEHRLLPLATYLRKAAGPLEDRGRREGPASAPRLSFPHNTAPADALVRLTTCAPSQFLRAMHSGAPSRLPIQGSPRICVAGGPPRFASMF